MKVVAIRNDNDFWSLTPGKEYYVIGLDHESYRVVDDKGDPILFSREGFRISDDTVPDDWIWDRFSEDEYYAGPKELQAPGFYEDYFEGKQDAVKKFEEFVGKLGIRRGDAA